MCVPVAGASRGLAPCVLCTLGEQHEVVLLSHRLLQAECATTPWAQGDIRPGAVYNLEIVDRLTGFY
jgi:hypothetical protein